MYIQLFYNLLLGIIKTNKTTKIHNLKPADKQKLNKVYRYEEGIMTTKEWLELHKSQGAKIEGNQLYIGENTFYNLTKLQQEYFNSIKNTESKKDFFHTVIQTKFGSTPIYGESLKGLFRHAEEYGEHDAEFFIMEYAIYKNGTPVPVEQICEEFNIAY